MFVVFGYLLLSALVLVIVVGVVVHRVRRAIVAHRAWPVDLDRQWGHVVTHAGSDGDDAHWVPVGYMIEGGHHAANARYRDAYKYHRVIRDRPYGDDADPAVYTLGFVSTTAHLIYATPHGVDAFLGAHSFAAVEHQPRVFVTLLGRTDRAAIYGVWLTRVRDANEARAALLKSGAANLGGVMLNADRGDALECSGARTVHRFAVRISSSAGFTVGNALASVAIECAVAVRNRYRRDGEAYFEHRVDGRRSGVLTAIVRREHQLFALQALHDAVQHVNDELRRNGVAVKITLDEQLATPRKDCAHIGERCCIVCRKKFMYS